MGRQSIRHPRRAGPRRQPPPSAVLVLLKTEDTLPPAISASWFWRAVDGALTALDLEAHPRFRVQLAMALRLYATLRAHDSVPRPPTISQVEAIAPMISSARALLQAIGEMQRWLSDRELLISALSKSKRLEKERATLETWLASWEQWLSGCEIRAPELRRYQRTPRGRGAPPDLRRQRLAHSVFAALEEAGLTLAPTHGGDLAEVINVIWAAADRIDGRRPRKRGDLYRRLRGLLKTYRTKRPRVT